MRAARQQAEDLEQAGTFLTSIITPGGEAVKALPAPKETAPQRQSNGRSKGSKLEHVARFAEPPAPPPQQPLPEKPDSAKASPVTNSFTNLLKRSDTAKQPNNTATSPTNTQNSQMVALMETLNITKKELESQGARVKQLENMLKQERSAREKAEERARRLEQHTASRPVSSVEEQSEPGEADPDLLESTHTESAANGHTANDADERTKNLQQHLDQVLGDMQRLKSDVDKFQQRAESAEADAASARKSLAEMIEKLREENEEADRAPRKTHRRRSTRETSQASRESTEDEDDPNNKTLIQRPKHANGHIRAPRLPEHLERAVATVLQEKNGNGDSLAQSAPYVSMLGVVLIGVGLMAYLNSWQRTER